MKQLFSNLRGVLERADAVSKDEPTLRKEIALVYRRMGDVESTALLPQLADKKEAARSYRRAAVIAADIRGADDVWARQQITEISGLLNGLGTLLDAEIAQTPTVVEAAPPPPVPTPTRGLPGKRLRSRHRNPLRPASSRTWIPRHAPISSSACRSRRSTPNGHGGTSKRCPTTSPAGARRFAGDVESLLGQVDGFIEDARGSLEENDVANAEEYLRRASYQLRRVFQVVGG